ncbi:MAG: ribosome hibernation-promoting factor, HPF/YfiA family [Bryobacteraceae bacterium]
MKLIYSGKTRDFTPELEARILNKLSKLSKVAEQRGEREVHFVHQMERHLHKVEILMNFYDHPLVGEAQDEDLTVALTLAAEKLEKQLLKQRDRWRDTHRDAKTVRSGKENWDGAAATPSLAPSAEEPRLTGVNGSARKPKVFRVNYDEDRKPMTLAEAMLEIDGTDYVVFRNSDRNCLSVLIKRPDGNFDLIE